MVKENYSRDMCDPSLSDKDRNSFWLALYYAKWKTFPVKQLNVAMNKNAAQLIAVLKAACDCDEDKLGEGLSEAVKEAGRKFDIKRFGMAFDLCKEGDDLEKVKKIVKEQLEDTANEKIHTILDSFLANHIAKGAVGPLEKDGEKTAEKGIMSCLADSAAETIGASLGDLVLKDVFADLCDPVVGLVDVVAEITVVGLLHAFGINDKRVDTLAADFTGIFVMVAAGAIIGGPVGAGIGAIVGVASVIIGATVGMVFDALKGGYKDDWCYIETGYMRRGEGGNISASCYKGDDGLYLIPYQTKYYESKKYDYFSAGNKQDESFQVALYDEWGNCIKTYTQVSYRDTFFVSKHPTDGSLLVVYARGGFNKESDKHGSLAGRVELLIHK